MVLRTHTRRPPSGYGSGVGGYTTTNGTNKRVMTKERTVMFVCPLCFCLPVSGQRGGEESGACGRGWCLLLFCVHTTAVRRSSLLFVIQLVGANLSACLL